MSKKVSIILLLGGVVLMIMGAQATNFTDVSRLFTAAPTDEAICLLIGGASVIALVGTFRRSKQT